MKNSKLALSFVAICCLGTFGNAASEPTCPEYKKAQEALKPKQKRTLNGDMTEVYNVLPPKVTNISDALTKGEFYGRLRFNSFMWDWDIADSTASKDNQAVGVGGSIIYKTAPLYGISATAGLYAATSPFGSLNEDDADVKFVKSGKDTFSRYNVKTDSTWSMVTLAQAYLQYDVAKTSIKVGRQLVDTPLTASNDTKMIPNAFEGLTVVSKDIADTTLTGAYLTGQKLRDHSSFHDVLTFKDKTGESWNNNDDSGVHQGLTYARLQPIGLEHNKLIIGSMQNKSISNLTLDATYGTVPDMLSYIVGEANYKIALNDKLSLTPGIRHMQQFDDGAGTIGGATLSGSLATATAGVPKFGYSDPKSLDGSVTMARLALTDGIFKAQLGYSKTADNGDIVAPWRSFPTGGYTRGMAQSNWNANTEATMLELSYDLGKAKLIPGFKVMGRYIMQDFDTAKQAAGVQADSNVIHIDLVKQVTPSVDVRFRTAFVDSEKRVLGSSAGKDVDSYNEYRFEVNYLF